MCGAHTMPEIKERDLVSRYGGNAGIDALRTEMTNGSEGPSEIEACMYSAACTSDRPGPGDGPEGGG